MSYTSDARPAVFHDWVSNGLTADEVARRTAAGAVNRASERNSRSVVQILRDNMFTRFNALIGALCALVLVFGSPIDALFGLVIVVNSGVGVIQELRAKRTLDRLALVGQAPVRVRRACGEVAVRPESVVVDDVVLLSAGEKVPVDGTVVESDGLEVDESLLTGEADPVLKKAGERVLSGSFAAAGTGAFTVTNVGSDAYAARLVADVSRFSLANSELYQGINRFLRYLTWVIVPVAALLVVRQFTRGETVANAVVGSVAGVVPMIPEGLVLMTSVAFAVGVIRLGRRRCLVQELPAVELLARVDTLCLDKTGTLTEPGLRLREIEPASGAAGAEQMAIAQQALAALVSRDTHPNPTVRAVAENVGPAPGWRAEETRPFSSARKYSGAVFEGHGAWLLGAPDVLLAENDPYRDRAEQLGAAGLRVLSLVRASTLDGNDRRVAALVVLEQKLRTEATSTLRYFVDQGVAVKVLSGDNAVAVGAVAAKLGVVGAAEPVDARDLPGVAASDLAVGAERERLAEIVDTHSIFGRVTPQQKRVFVTALQSRGHVVAMTGDGVNDVLALNQADLGIAMGSGSGATRAVAKVVLLDDDFAVLPKVVAEGRRVLANIERVANLFLTKTVYSIVLALLVGVARLPFPFLPRHITLVASLTIGIPGFFLALAPSAERARPGFVARVLRFAAPVGLTCALTTFVAYGIARANPASDLDTDRSTATLTLFLVAFWALTLVARPYNAWRVGMLAAMASCFVLVATVPGLREFVRLPYGDLANDGIALGCAAVGMFVLTVALRVQGLDIGRLARRRAPTVTPRAPARPGF